MGKLMSALAELTYLLRPTRSNQEAMVVKELETIKQQGRKIDPQTAMGIDASLSPVARETLRKEKALPIDLMDTEPGRRV